MWYNWCHSYWLMQNKYKLLSYEKIYIIFIILFYIVCTCIYHVAMSTLCIHVWLHIDSYCFLYYWLKVNTIFHKSLINTPLYFEIKKIKLIMHVLSTCRSMHSLFCRPYMCLSIVNINAKALKKQRRKRNNYVYELRQGYQYQILYRRKIKASYMLCVD